ncbi:MAG: HDOD domain-containing protein [Verrucomicrobiales bacterium]|nr:HDOD domain-containing protein [Verrucomicrobiales bacterium]
MRSRKFEVLEAVSRIERFDASPVVLSKALRLLRDPNSEGSALVETIQADPALTAGVINLANSAYYGVSARIATLEEAVRLLGFREVYQMVSVSVAQRLFNSPLRSYGTTPQADWETSVFCALVMQRLAPGHGLDDGEAYTIGLLHAIGRLAIDQALGETGDIDAFRTDPSPWEQREVRYVGLTSTEVSAMLLERWRFPERTCEALRRQTSPPSDRDDPLQACLQIARLCAAGMTGESVELPTHPCLQARLLGTGLDGAGLNALLASCRQRLDALRQALSA